MNPVHLAAGIAGIAAVIGGYLWHLRARHRRDLALKASLVAPDPVSRIVAVDMLASRGIADHADVLRERSQVETDPEVQRALAEVVLRHQWEPVTDSKMVELRVWASRLLSQATRGWTGPDRRRPWSQVSKAWTGPERRRQRAADASRQDGDESSNRQRSPLVQQQGPRVPVVVVTGAGSPAGPGMVRRLRLCGYKVVALETNPSFIGRRTDHGTIGMPPATDASFVEALISAARSAGALSAAGEDSRLRAFGPSSKPSAGLPDVAGSWASDPFALRTDETRTATACLLVPADPYEVLVLSRASERLRSLGIATLLPAPGSVLACADRWLLYQVLSNAGVQVPAAALGSSGGIPGPWTVVPRYLRGSSPALEVAFASHLAAAMAQVRSPLVVTKTPGRTFVVDVVAPGIGPVLTFAQAVLPMRDGRAALATAERIVNPDLAGMVEAVVGALALTGAFSIEGVLSPGGQPVVSGVSPALSAYATAGFAGGEQMVGAYVSAIQQRYDHHHQLASFTDPGVELVPSWQRDPIHLAS